MAGVGRTRPSIDWWDHGLVGVEALDRTVMSGQTPGKVSTRIGRRVLMRVQVVKVPPLVGKILQAILGIWAKGR